MKSTYFKYIISAVITGLVAVGCSDVVNKDDDWDNDMGANGAPVVRKVTASSDTTATITTAFLNQSIAIFGDNLAHVKEVRVNDINVDLSQIYAKRHRLEIVIPRVLPETITNTLTIKTNLGETTIPLNVTVPKLKIKGFFNDFAANEDTVQIIGSDFDLYEIDSIRATVKFNNQDIKIFYCKEGSFSIQVPEGTPIEETSYLTISSPRIKNTISIPFREIGIPILTNDEAKTWQGWPWFASGYVDVTEDSEPAAPMFKRYVTFKKSAQGAGSYENILISHFWLDESAADMMANPENYCVKMEMLNPVGVPFARLIKIGTEESEGEGLMYDWDPAVTNDGVSLNTMGAWQTISLEVTNVFPAKNGNKTNLRIAKDPYVNTNEFNNFKMASYRVLAGDSEFYFWNIRIVKKLKIE